jgi:hypothetical protein
MDTKQYSEDATIEVLAKKVINNLIFIDIEYRWDEVLILANRRVSTSHLVFS